MYLMHYFEIATAFGSDIYIYIYPLFSTEYESSSNQSTAFYAYNYRQKVIRDLMLSYVPIC